MAILKSPETYSNFVSELNIRDPFQQWQIVDVQFPSTANTDYVIRHKLAPQNPRDVHYRVIKQFNNGVVYESAAPGGKQWGSDFIVLRSDKASWCGRILLGVVKYPSFNLGVFPDIPSTP